MELTPTNTIKDIINNRMANDNTIVFLRPIVSDKAPPDIRMKLPKDNVIA